MNWICGIGGLFIGMFWGYAGACAWWRGRILQAAQCDTGFNLLDDEYIYFVHRYTGIPAVGEQQ